MSKKIPPTTPKKLLNELSRAHLFEREISMCDPRFLSRDDPDLSFIIIIIPVLFWQVLLCQYYVIASDTNERNT